MGNCLSGPSVMTLLDDEILKAIQRKAEIIFLEYETKSDDEDVLLISNETCDKYTFSFFDGVQNKFDLIDYDKNVKIPGPTYNFSKKGIHTIKMVIKEQILDFSCMFFNCVNLKEIKGYINTSESKNLSWMFSNCTSLVDISALKNIDVSKVENFEGMFNECTSLEDVSPIQNWNVGEGKNFCSMFKNCKSLKINRFKSWNIQKNGVKLDHIYDGCNIFKNNGDIDGINPNQ